MGTALILTAPRTLDYRSEPDLPLKDDEVRVRTLHSGVSAGTELTYYRGTNPFLTKKWDESRRLFLANTGESVSPYPITHLGYEEVGKVVELGKNVSDIPLGALVFGTWGHRTHYIATAAYARLRLMPPGADPLFGIFSHLGAIALNGVHDAAPRLGETVAVFGVGALGQLVVSIAKNSGARVIAVDVRPERLEQAKKMGAEITINTSAMSAAEEIKRLTAKGADVCIEVSGVGAALNEAIRSVVYSGRVVAMGFLQGEPRGLFLGDEYHHNRVDLLCSQISGVSPERSNRWDKPRLWQTAVAWQAEGRLDFRPVITHRFPFREARQLYELIDQRPQEVLHAVLDFEDDV